MLWGDEASPYALAQVPPTLLRQEKHGKVNYAGGRQSKLNIREWPGQVYKEKRARALGSLRARLILL